MADYAIIDGERVAPGTANSYENGLKPGFENAFPGLSLIISSGTRTWDEQNALYQDYISGRSSIRAANPDDPEAYHVETNPTGPRAIDIRDTGSDAGVTQYENARSDWIVANAMNWGFDPRGYREFNEPWHLEYQGDLWVPLNIQGDDMQADERQALFDIRSALLDGLPGHDLSTAAITQGILATLDIQNRILIKDATGTPVWDAFQEMVPNIRTILASVGKLSTGTPPAAPGDIQAIADAIRSGLGKDLADELAKRLAS